MRLPRSDSTSDWGFLHADTPNRDSLACDLMEPVRPEVDRFVLDWFLRQPLKREWFAEQRNGTCRLTGVIAARLADSSNLEAGGGTHCGMGYEDTVEQLNRKAGKST